MVLISPAISVESFKITFPSPFAQLMETDYTRIMLHNDLGYKGENANMSLKNEQREMTCIIESPLPGITTPIIRVDLKLASKMAKRRLRLEIDYQHVTKHTEF